MMRLFLALLGLLMTPLAALAEPCVCVSCLFGAMKHHRVVSSSMSPALPTGACIFARQIGGDISQVTRGDVITFQEDGHLYVFRVVAFAGERVQIVDGVPRLQGAPLAQSPLPDHKIPFAPSESGMMPRCQNAPGPGGTCVRGQARETLPNGVSYPVLNINEHGILDNTAETEVPAGHVFVLGDNRDNASDSRVPRRAGGRGFVPYDMIRGIVEDIKP